MGFLSDVVNVGTLGFVGDGPLSFGGKPAQGGTVTPSQSSSFSTGTVTPSRSNSFTDSFGFNQSGQNLFAPQQQALSPFFGFTGDLLNTFGQDPSQLIAGFNPLQRAGQQAAINAPTQGVFNQAREGFTQALQTDPSQNPFFQSSLQAALNPFVRNFTQQVLPSIRSQAIGVGQPGGSREAIAQGIGLEGLLSQMGDITARMGSDAFGQGLQARQQALGFAPQLAGLGLMPAQTLMDVGGQQQAQQQRFLNAPFSFGQNIQGLLGSPITLSNALGLTGSTGGTQSTGAVTGPTFSSSTGDVSQQTGRTPSVFELAGQVANFAF